VRIAALAALARIGNPEALDAVRAATHDRSREVKRQARATQHTLEVIAARTGTRPSNNGGGPAPLNPSPQARYYVGLGGMGNRSGIRGEELKGLLRRYLQEQIAESPTVVITPPDESPTITSKVIKTRRLTGVWLDGSITSVTHQNGGIRAEISLMVMTNPGRDLRMMLSGAASVSAGSNLSPGVEQDLENQALRGAATGAVRRLMTQLSSGVGLEPP
jgi:hypothetical protein